MLIQPIDPASPMANPPQHEPPADDPDGATVLELMTRQLSMSLPPLSTILLRMAKSDMRRNVPMPNVIRVAEVERLPARARALVLAATCAEGASTIMDLMCVAVRRKCTTIVCDLKTMYFSGDGALALHPGMCARPPQAATLTSSICSAGGGVRGTRTRA
jgi:hypothetical protein